MRIVPVSLLLAFTLVSGCLGDDSPPADDEPVETGTIDTEPYDLQFNQGGTIVGVVGSATPANPDGCNGLNEEGVDIVYHRWTAPADENGTPLKVLRLTATLTMSEPALLDADMDINGPNGELLGVTTDFNVQTGPSETFTTEGNLDPGEYTFTVRGCSGRGAYHLSVTFQMQRVDLAAEAAPEPVAGNATAE